VRFRGITGTSFTSDIAIDDVVIADAPVVDLGPDTSTCAGNQIILDAGSGSGYSYIWKKLPLLTVLGTSQTLTVNSSGTYYVDVTDPYYFTSTDTIIATFNAPPTVGFSGLNVNYCANSPTSTLIGSPLGGTFSGPGITTNIFSPLSAGTGTHQIVYTYIDPSTLCSNTSSQNVSVNAIQSVGFTGLAASYCINSPLVNLSGNPSGGSFSGPGITGNSFNPATATVGTHSIIYSYTDVNNCTNSDTQSVIVNPLPTVTYSGLASSYCANSTAVSLSGNPSGGTFSGNGISGSNFNPANAGTGSITIDYVFTDINGCSNTSSQSTFINTLPTVSFTNLSATYCVNSNPATLIGNPLGGSFSGNGINGNLFNPSSAGAGTHNIIYSYSDLNNCSNSDTQSVVVNALPIVSAGTDTSIHWGHDTILYGSASGGSNTFSYSWSPADSLINANVQNPQTVSLKTTNIFTLIVTDLVSNCQNTSQVTITVVGGQLYSSASANPSSICEGGTSVLSSNGSGGSGIYSYQWSSNPTGFNSYVQNPIVQPTITTTYSVTVNDGSNTSISTSVVTVNPTTPVMISGLLSSYCQNDPSAILIGSPSGGTFSGLGVIGNTFDPVIAGVGIKNITYTFLNGFGLLNPEAGDQL